MTNWHRLFGLFLIDFFTNSPYAVELEKDLSIKQQWLDVVVLRKMPSNSIAASATPTSCCVPGDTIAGAANPTGCRLPDGLDGLADHNLLTYKSLREPLDDWAIKELIGHYVNYRKQVSQSMNHLLPQSHFKLYAVSTRNPQKLKGQVTLTPVSPGVYDVVWGTDTIRLIVLSQIPDGEHNAIWRLFSAQREAVIQARQQYQMHQPDISTIVNDLFQHYQQEKIIMSYTVEDYKKEQVRNNLDLLSADEILARYSADEVLKRYSADDRLKDLTVDDIRASLSPDVIKLLMQNIDQMR